MGIRISVKTKKPASLKLYNHINSFLFEEEYGELKGIPSSEIDKIREARKVLSKIIKDGKI